MQSGRIVDVRPLDVEGAASGVRAITAELGVRTALDYGSDVISPGLVDMHVHFDEPGREDWEGVVHEPDDSTNSFPDSSPCPQRPWDLRRTTAVISCSTERGLPSVRCRPACAAVAQYPNKTLRFLFQ